MSCEALTKWLGERHPGLLRQINAKTPPEAVESLNWITGLRLTYRPGAEDQLCAQYLNAMKGKPVAINPYQGPLQISNQSLQDWAARQQLDEMQWQTEKAMRELQAKVQKNQSPPEPNKVLLLLGEDE
jgi:hypothetical protein